MIFTCKPTYYVSVAAAIPQESKIDQNYSKQHNAPSNYNMGAYSTKMGFFQGLGQASGNQAANGSAVSYWGPSGTISTINWGVNCFKLS